MGAREALLFGNLGMAMLKKTSYEPIGEEGSAPPPPTDEDPPRVAAEVTNPANFQAVKAAATKLTAEVQRLTALINSLPGNAQIPLKTGGFLTGSELKALWGQINYLVTDRTNFGTDRGGAVIGTLSQMHFSTVTGYDAVQNGLAFIALHEMMHLTNAAKSYDQQMWTNHLNAGGTAQNYNSTSQWFRQNEVFVNFAARGLMNSFPDNPIDITPLTNDGDPSGWMPPYGF